MMVGQKTMLQRILELEERMAVLERGSVRTATTVKAVVPGADFSTRERTRIEDRKRRARRGRP